MSKTHSTVKHFEDIGNIYTANIIPKTNEQLLGEGEAVNTTSSDTAFEPNGGHDMQKHDGPEAAEGFEPIENDIKTKKKKKTAYAEETLSQPVKVPKKAVKKESNKINNSTMKENKTNKSTFDRLFEDVMGDDLDLEIGDDNGGFDELGDEGGEDIGGDVVTLELPRDLAEGLHSALMDQLGGNGDEIEDIEDTEPELGDDLEMPESHVELTAAADSVGSLTGMGNKVSGSGHTAAGGSASSDAGGQEDGGKPKVAHDGAPGLMGKNNKVGGKVTGGNKDFFRA